MFSNFYKKEIALIRFSDQINQKTINKFISKIKKLEDNKKRIKGVAFVIDSPGGSLFQSVKLVDYITNFTKSNNIPLHTYSEGIAASGGYYLLACGDKVFTRKDSLVGSIGVISIYMNLKSFYDKYKLESLYLNSGYSEFSSSHKQLSSNNEEYNLIKKDPKNDLFKNHNMFIESDNEVRKKEFSKLLDEFGDQFHSYVKKQRNGKLPKDGEMLKEVFSASVFMGDKAVKLGLCDNVYEDLSHKNLLKDFNYDEDDKNVKVVDYHIKTLMDYAKI